MIGFVRTSVLVLAFALAAHGPAAAQAESDPLRLFIEELLSDFMFADGRPEIRLGALASRLPPLPIITEEVLGSVEYTTFSLSLVRTSQPSDLIARVRETLQHQGWTPKARDVPSGFSMKPAYASPFMCSDNSFLAISANGRGQVVIAEGSGVKLMSQCVETAPRGPDGRPVPPLPPLDPPAGAISLGGGMSGGDSWEFSTRLVTELPPEEILDHYIWEMIQAGATFDAESVTPISAVAPFDFVDSHGTRWRGTLAVMTTAPTNERRVPIYYSGNSHAPNEFVEAIRLAIQLHNGSLKQPSRKIWRLAFGRRIVELALRALGRLAAYLVGARPKWSPINRHGEDTILRRALGVDPRAQSVSGRYAAGARCILDRPR